MEDCYRHVIKSKEMEKLGFGGFEVLITDGKMEFFNSDGSTFVIRDKRIKADYCKKRSTRKGAENDITNVKNYITNDEASTLYEEYGELMDRGIDVSEVDIENDARKYICSDGSTCMYVKDLLGKKFLLKIKDGDDECFQIMF